MNIEILKTVGQIAGIGGIALGVFLLLFRDVIRKKIFPSLTKEQGYRILVLFLILVWSVAISGVGAWLFVEIKTQPSVITSPESRVVCGVPTLRAIRPPAMLENQTREYRLIGTGFCRDSVVYVDTPAWVGNKRGTHANSSPIKVAPDGTWLTVYVGLPDQPHGQGVNVIVENPDLGRASLFVGFQR